MVLASAKLRGTVADVPRLAPRIHNAVLDLVDLLVDIAHCEDGDQGGEDDDAGLDGLRAARRRCRAGRLVSAKRMRGERKTKSDGSSRMLLTSAILVVLRHTDVHDGKLLGKRQNRRSEVDPHVHPAQGEDRRRNCRTRPSISIIAH